VLLWLLVAGATRFLLLGRWSLWGDEANTYLDTDRLLHGEWMVSVKTWPLFFLLEAPFLRLLRGPCGLEVALRFLPALSATLAPAVLFRGTRAFLGRAERHLLAGLVVASPWLLFHAQFARHYATLFLFSGVAVVLFLEALRRDRLGTMVHATLWLVAVGLVHPTGWALFAGCLLVALVQPGLPTRRAAATTRPLWIVLVLGVLLAALRFGALRDTLWYKLTHRDAGAETLPDLVLGLVYNLGLPVCVLALIGLPRLWRRDRFLGAAVVLICGPTLLGLFAVAGLGTWVEQRYWIPVVGLFLIPAAVCLADLGRALGRQGRLLGAAPATLVLVAALPGLLSHYRDGDRPDLRGAAEFVADRIGADEFVVVENHVLFQTYAPAVPEAAVQEAPPRVGDGMYEFQTAMKTAAGVWVVLPEAFRQSSGARSDFLRWARTEGRLVREFGKGRLDYHQNRLSVFHVDPRRAARYRTSERPESAPDRAPGDADGP